MNNNEMNAKAEVLMMGVTVEVKDNAESLYILDYVAKTLKEDFTGTGVMNKAMRFTKNGLIKHMSINKLEDMTLITMTMTTDEDEEPYDLLSRDGVFGYVYNVTVPDFSELGYSYFERGKDSMTRRIG